MMYIFLAQWELRARAKDMHTPQLVQGYCDGSELELCHGQNCIPPKFIGGNPNPQYLRMGPYLEIGSLKR